jgi:hypothetical protein
LITRSTQTTNNNSGLYSKRLHGKGTVQSIGSLSVTPNF